MLDMNLFKFERTGLLKYERIFSFGGHCNSKRISVDFRFPNHTAIHEFSNYASGLRSGHVALLDKDGKSTKEHTYRDIKSKVYEDVLSSVQDFAKDNGIKLGPLYVERCIVVYKVSGLSDNASYIAAISFLNYPYWYEYVNISISIRKNSGDAVNASCRNVRMDIRSYENVISWVLYFLSHCVRRDKPQIDLYVWNLTIADVKKRLEEEAKEKAKYGSFYLIVNKTLRDMLENNADPDSIADYLHYMG